MVRVILFHLRLVFNPPPPRSVRRFASRSQFSRITLIPVLNPRSKVSKTA
jgi:hypothetical protein